MSAAVLIPKPPSLFQLEDDLLALLETGEGGIPEELRAEYEAELHHALIATKAKRDRVAEFSRHLEAQAELAKAEAKRLHQRAADFLILQERLHSYIRRTMEATGQTKLEGQFTTWALRKNPPATVIDDPLALPDTYKRHIESWEPDKMAIKAALKSGTAVPGASLAPDSFRLERR